MPTVAAPDIEHGFELLHSTTALIVFTIPGIIALVVEPVLFVLADRYPRRWFIAGGLGMMAAASFAAALAPGPVVFAIAIAIWFVANGIAVALAQATLVDRSPDHRARTMTRWTLCALAGDLAAPLVLAALAALGLGWRAAFAVVGGVLVVGCVGVTTRFGDPPRAAGEDGDDEPSLWQALRAAVRDRVLVLWLFGMALCDLLDEILVVFASLHVRHELDAGPTWQAVILGSFMIGGAIGLVALDRLLGRHPDRTLLVVSALACAISYVAWLAAPSPWLSALLMLPVGATSAPLYPLVAARAYARCPGHSGIVLAASHMFAPVALALPFGVGLVADHAGTYVALALLVVQPLGLMALARSRDGVRSADP